MRYLVGVRHVLLLLSLIHLGGCLSVGANRIAPPGPTGSAADGGAPVLLVVVEGLRVDALRDHLRRIREEDFEPEWPSGLAMLGAAGFELATSERASAPLPAGGLAALGSIATGAFPGAHGVPGDRFHEVDAEGRVRAYDFRAGPDAARLLLGAGGAPVGESPLDALLRVPTLHQRLAASHRSVSVFFPFGAGAERLVPADLQTAVVSRLPTDASSGAAPLLDHAAREAAVERLLGGPAPDLLTIAFGRVRTDSCYQEDADCDDDSVELRVAQRRALRRVDEHLWRLLRAWRRAHPEGFERATVLLTGTGGAVRRAKSQRMDADALRARLAEGAGPECGEVLRGPDVRIDLDDGVARFTLRPAPPGQQEPVLRARTCLSAALEAAVAEAPWVAGAVWLPPGGTGPRAQRAVVELRPSFERALPAWLRTRTRVRLRRAFDDAARSRSGDALLFASAPTWFSEEPLGAPAGAGFGGLEPAAMGTAFLVASRSLEDTFASTLRTTAVELADIVPTVLALLGVGGEAAAGLERPPLLRRDESVLRLVAADRRLTLPERSGAPTAAWIPTADGARLELAEAMEHWPPEAVRIRAGEAIWTWGAEGGWGQGAPCHHEEERGRRRWWCDVPRDAAPGLRVAATRRTPSVADGSAADAHDDALFAVRVGDAAPAIEGVELRCADEAGARLRVKAVDGLGLARVELAVVDAHGASGLSTAEAPLGEITADAACSDPMAVGCAFSGSRTSFDGELEVPLGAALVRHHRAVFDIEEPASAAVERMWLSFGRSSPGRAWVRARVCNVAGRCVDRPLVDDVAWLEAVSRGCR